MLPVLPAEVLLLITDMLTWSDQAALASTSRVAHQPLRPFVCAHTSRLRSIVRNWSSRSLPPARQAVSWPDALQSAGCNDAALSFVIPVAPLLTVHMGFIDNPDQLAGQLALKVHRALCKCPCLRNIYTQALSLALEQSAMLNPFVSLVNSSVRDNRTEFRRCFDRLLSHLYRQHALYILARPTLLSLRKDFDPESTFSKPLNAHLIYCFVGLAGLQRQI